MNTNPLKPNQPKIEYGPVSHTLLTDIPVWPYAYGPPPGQGRIRISVDDFIVDEVLGFEHSGEGEHACLYIEKRGENTDYVARNLARFACVSGKDVGYAGLKDRHALTRQWFSVRLPGKSDPDWRQFESDSIKVLRVTRHQKKLKRGALTANEFQLTIRDWQGDMAITIARLEMIKILGIPNYFGSQRFGHDGQNVNKALAMFGGQRVKRHLRSIYLSAARSFLFNRILAARVRQQNWNNAITGDTFIFDRSRQYFKAEQLSADIIHRVDAGLIHPSGCLWGTGEAEVSGEALAIENQVLSQFQLLAQGLKQAGVAMDRRTLRVYAEHFCWNFVADDVLQLSFSLPAGSYATSLLREIILIQEP